MTRPESVFGVTSIWDGDSPAQNAFVWTLEEALAIVARHHAYASVNVVELHPTKGKRTILAYAPDAGLMEFKAYQTRDERWRPGYPAVFVQALLDQYPAPIANPWAGQR